MRTKKIAVFLCVLAAGAVSIRTAGAEELIRIRPLPQFISDTYQEKDVLVSFSRAYSRTDNYASQFCVELNIRVLSENKILKPNKYAYGIYILDNFGNDLNVVNMAPRYFDTLRPGEKRLFIITASIMPLDNTKYLLLQIPRGLFGNVNPFELKIFNTGFKGTTSQERAMLESGMGLGGWDKEDVNIKFLPEDIILKNRGMILYTAVFIEICALCALAAIVFACLRKAKKTVRNCESLLGFCFHWLAKTNPPISLLYIFSILIYVVWLMFGLIIVVAGGAGNVDDLFGILLFLAVWGLLSLVVLWVIYEALNKWRVFNHN